MHGRRGRAAGTTARDTVDADEAEARAVQDAVARGTPAGPFDLARVRIHADGAAAARARDAGSAALTIGDDVYFASGRYRPETPRGRALLAHELTHVAQQRRDGHPRAQHAPDEEATERDPAAAFTKAASGGDLELPWSWGDYRALERTVSGVRFLIALGESQVAAATAVVPALATRIAADNALIADPARRVTTCFITPATTRFAYWGGTAVVMLDPKDASVGAVAHEMGHAILDAMMRQGAARPSAAATARAGRAPTPVRVADLYLRLKETVTPVDSTVPVGLMMVDPSEWSPGAASEHPWQNADEFFASARAAYVLDLKGLKASIARAATVDKAVGPLGRELLALLQGLGAKIGAPSPLPADRAAAATTELGRAKHVSRVEDSAAGGAYPLLGWLLAPDTRRGRR